MKTYRIRTTVINGKLEPFAEVEGRGLGLLAITPAKPSQPKVRARAITHLPTGSRIAQYDNAQIAMEKLVALVDTCDWRFSLSDEDREKRRAAWEATRGIK